MADVEERVQTILPQLTRTVQAADELMAIISEPARRSAPNLVGIEWTGGVRGVRSVTNPDSEFMRR